MRKLICTLFSLLLILTACSNSDEDVDNTSSCPDNIACTQVFISLTFSPKTANGVPIFLDSYYSQNLDNGETYSILNSSVASTASYVVISDEQIEQINQEGTNIRFIGLQGNQIVVQQDFLVGHDCCHVVPLGGPFDDQ
ncbi:hypothetical protein BFP97_08465 [Roseivirga sp. 4D4]|uniref:hypothetical protein n=1 Tax=Roseivirga sp. 4D4 TaxID=1889784 RepID=UPI000853E173|nr:hypothetical protein [Roseivirga sp. 4D4]OEK01552.1 hypothetical protein BFP97_08465 [Roseivirga sp. 4D4]